jgi:hypothetical protein
MSNAVNTGIDITPFTKDESVKFDNNFLYYAQSRLTDDYYIKHCYVYDNGLSNTGAHKIFCIGPVEEGEFVCTCPFYGVGMRGASEDTSFAKSLQKKTSFGVELINVVFL